MNTVKLRPAAAIVDAVQSANAGSLCRHDAITVSEGMDLATASRLLRDRHTHHLLVRDHCSPSLHQIVGIVSGHEIATSVVAREGDPRMLTVADIMVRPPLFLRAGQTVESLPSLMCEAGASVAPVLSEKGELLGMLALEDLLARTGMSGGSQG